MDQTIDLQKPRIDTVSSIYKFHTSADVLRLDLVHPVVSGNKWYKLKGWLNEARQLHKKTIISFGGAYSNHIVATAAACAATGFKSIGLVRGERPVVLSHTLLTAENYGMELMFLTREDYRLKKIPFELSDEMYLINDGGYGKNGLTGVMELMDDIDISAYTHILSAAGTGTTLAGIVMASGQGQKAVGISVMKNNHSLEDEINRLLPGDLKDRFSLLHDYHFGGYAKYTSLLIRFMNDWFERSGMPLDFVYTGKLFYAVEDLLRKGYFPQGSRLLLVHSGGLQGNLSLPKGTLIF